MSKNTEIAGAAQPGRRRSRNWIAAAAVVFLAAAGGGAWYAYYGHGHGGAENPVVAGEKYTCGMHPWIIQDKPGNCPICGMTLTRIAEQPGPGVPAAAPGSGAAEFFGSEDRGRAARATEDDGAAAREGPATQHGGRKILFYRSPMNPAVTSPAPARDEMGMDYVPVYADEMGAPEGGADPGAAGAAGPRAGAGAAVEGLATIRVGEEALRLSGVQTAAATRETVRRTVRTVGIVVPDETRVRHVHTKVEGWVEKLYTNFTGEVVRQGQPILSLYSPQLLTTQEEFLKARETAAKFATSASPDVRSLGAELQQSARRRLELFDVPKSFIDQVERTGTAQRNVILNAPLSGYVTAKDVFEGQKVEPGMDLFTVTDLSRVWIEADLYEYEAGTVKVGQEATLALAYQPYVRLTGQVAFVFPYLSAESRTLKVRFEFPNPELVLKPQMYADVSLALATAQGVAIPDSALIDTGVRRVVFVETAPGTFEPREVKIGVRGEGRAQVLAGVGEGEKVVIRANFLLDSESRLRAALTQMAAAAAGQGRPSGPGPTDGAGASR
ncbi:MAG: efflux RND transporter periplasmic adaptor subunit [Deferrisomatales bacterium]|nr:efflux RND transporter periplasmic adaptor subunit [Deferrisomatales bacterium]